jgi:hypothetical protein
MPLFSGNQSKAQKVHPRVPAAVRNAFYGSLPVIIATSVDTCV